MSLSVILTPTAKMKQSELLRIITGRRKKDAGDIMCHGGCLQRGLSIDNFYSTGVGLRSYKISKLEINFVH